MDSVDDAQPWSDEKKRDWRYNHVFGWAGTDEQLIDGLMKAKKVASRIEAGELCPATEASPCRRLGSAAVVHLKSFQEEVTCSMNSVRRHDTGLSAR